jgi:hypothetical protein
LDRVAAVAVGEHKVLGKQAINIAARDKNGGRNLCDTGRTNEARSHFPYKLMKSIFARSRFPQYDASRKSEINGEKLLQNQ